MTVSDEVRVKPKEGGDGIEGLCFLGVGEKARLFAVNEDDPPLLMELNLVSGERQGEAVIVNTVPLRVRDLSELTLSGDGRRLVALSDRDNRLFEVSAEGQIGRQWNLPGHEQEGAALLPDGSLYVCEESMWLRIYSADDLRQLRRSASPQSSVASH